MEPEIREVERRDLAALYEVCLRTGDAGEDATGLFNDPTLLGEVFVGPYVVLDGCIGFVPVDREGPGGYTLAAVDTRAFEKLCEEKWWPQLRRSHPSPATSLSTPEDEVLAMIHHPVPADETVVATYPSHMHIDLLPRMQGKGVGSALMTRMLEALANAGSPGVHLEVDRRNLRAIAFYEKFQFVTLDSDDDTVIMGRHLEPQP